MACTNIRLPLLANTSSSESGMDSLEHSPDKKYFINYPYSISYNFNSRGFRDLSWPTDSKDLKSSIWCIGDSFTVGLGSPMDNIWPCVLQKTTGKRTINVSMDGASNEWISETATQIIDEINPDLIVLCWSYPERRRGSNEFGFQNLNNDFIKGYLEIKSPSWPTIDDIYDFNNLDIQIREEVLCEHNLYVKPLLTITNEYQITDVFVSDNYRRIAHTNDLPEDDLKNLLDCIKKTEQNKIKKIIHSFIPEFCNKKLKSNYYNEISKIISQPIYIERMDLARDSHHFDIKTSKHLVKNILTAL